MNADSLSLRRLAILDDKGREVLVLDAEHGGRVQAWVAPPGAAHLTEHPNVTLGADPFGNPEVALFHRWDRSEIALRIEGEPMRPRLLVHGRNGELRAKIAAETPGAPTMTLLDSKGDVALER